MKKVLIIICLCFAVSITYSQYSLETISIKKGETKTLIASGGIGKVFRWYTGSCGGNLVHEGAKFVITPIETTTYYGRWEDGKKVSACNIVIINVDVPVEPDPITLSDKPTPKDTIIIIKDTTIYKTDTLVQKVQVQNSRIVSNTKKYSFGKYSGDLKNGYPEGQGTMIYTKHVRIAKHDRQEHYAEAGYSLVGTWINGDISNGKLIDNNGNQIKVILAGARNSIYDLENDNK